MNCEIVYVCNSINNKNIRANELNILRKFEDSLYFEFGDSENNIKKRFYRNLETLNKDFAAVENIKERLEKEDITIKETNDIETEVEHEVLLEAVAEEGIAVAGMTEPEEVKVEEIKKVKNKSSRRRNIF